jgi:hypothetical protein
LVVRFARPPAQQTPLQPITLPVIEPSRLSLAVPRQGQAGAAAGAASAAAPGQQGRRGSDVGRGGAVGPSGGGGGEAPLSDADRFWLEAMLDMDAAGTAAAASTAAADAGGGDGAALVPPGSGPVRVQDAGGS